MNLNGMQRIFLADARRIGLATSRFRLANLVAQPRSGNLPAMT
jgi:hypothetical protein